MLYFSSLLQTDLKYGNSASNLFTAITENGLQYQLLNHTKDIWLRDFMPVQTSSGRFVSFRYEPSYLNDDLELQTNYRQDIAPQFDLSVTYSDINLDGGNIVYSPSKERAIISDRVFSENPNDDSNLLVSKLSKLLDAEIIIIPSLKGDMTGHADGMVRFVDESTVIGNDVPSVNGLEERIKRPLRMHGIDVIDFPYQSSKGISAVGCYLNFLETKSCILLPIFGIKMDEVVVSSASRIFNKKVIPVNIKEIAEYGGCLNCISWEKN